MRVQHPDPSIVVFAVFESCDAMRSSRSCPRFSISLEIRRSLVVTSLSPRSAERIVRRSRTRLAESILTMHLTYGEIYDTIDADLPSICSLLAAHLTFRRVSALRLAGSLFARLPSKALEKSLEQISILRGIPRGRERECDIVPFDSSIEETLRHRFNFRGILYRYSDENRTCVVRLAL